MISDKRIREIFFKFEQKRNIFDYKIEGVSFYCLLRFSMEMHIRSRFKIEDEIKSSSVGFVAKVKNKLANLMPKKRAKESYDKLFEGEEQGLSSPFLFVSTCEQKNEEGCSIDLYDIVKYYHNKRYKINFIQPNYGFDPFPQKSSNCDSFFPLYIDRHKNLPKEAKIQLNEFLKVLDEVEDFGFAQLCDYYDSLLGNLIDRASQLEEYIRQMNPKFVFARSVYTATWIVLACHKTNAKLIEVQHGVVGADNIYYQSIHKRNTLDYGDLIMPDYILTLGEKWREILFKQNSFYDESNTFTIGSSLYNKSPLLECNKEGKKRLTFTLQGNKMNRMLSINESVMNFIEQYIDRLVELNVEVIIRPHPSEFKLTSKFFKKYKKDVLIENPSSKSSIESIECSDWIVSATSMCLYEAMAMGKVAVSYTKFKGMNSNNPDIQYVQDNEQLFELVINHRKQLSLEYFQPFDGEVLENFETKN